MNYNQFISKFKNSITIAIKDWDAKVVFEPAKETEEEQEDLLIVEFSGEGMGTHIQRFHMEEIYRDFVKGKNMERLLCEAYECLNRCREIEKNSPLGHMNDYEAIREHLIIRPLNYGKNSRKLEDGVFEVIGDIALTLYVSIGNYDGLYTSTMVPKAVLESWGKRADEVLRVAGENTYRLFPPRLFNWLEFERFRDEDYGVFMERDPELKLEGGSCATFVTTKNQLNGAVVVFLPGVAKRLGELLGTDFYIAFTSMHEAAIHSCEKVNPETIRESLKGLNEEMPSEEDFLTEKVYYYSRKTDRIEEVVD